MSAEQLTMFEPFGQELASLARTHANTSHQLQCKSDALKLRGFLASARTFEALAELTDKDATQCEMALQFEQLAGLS